MALSGKQVAFVQSYLGEANFNATEAALLAGYSPKSAYSIGSENLKKPEIAQAIARHLEERCMGEGEVLARLADIARSDIGDVLDEAGELDIQRARRLRKTKLIKSITISEVDTKFGVSRRVRVELHDPLRALELIGKHHGLFKEPEAPPVTVNVHLGFEQAIEKVYGDSDGDSGT